MSLAAILERVEHRERRLTLVSPPSTAVVSRVEQTFAPQGVRVDVEDGADRPTILVRDGDELLSTVPLDTEEGRLDGTDLEATTDAVTTVLSRLDRTTFSSYDIRGMFAATREIEDRAWRGRDGRLRAGFQHVRALSQQRAVYAQLATALNVHVYAVPDGSPPKIEGATVHLAATAELERSWFVVYDGGERDRLKCALVAVERAPREFQGFLTYAPALVDEIDDYLVAAY